MSFDDVALYALCSSNDTHSIKIGKISGNVLTLMNQYSTRYCHQGYKLLRFWSGRDYYSIESLVHNHRLLVPQRLRNDTTGRLTEWFATTLKIIDTVVYSLVTEHRARNLQHSDGVEKVVLTRPVVTPVTSLRQIDPNTYIKLEVSTRSGNSGHNNQTNSISAGLKQVEVAIYNGPENCDQVNLATNVLYSQKPEQVEIPMCNQLEKSNQNNKNNVILNKPLTESERPKHKIFFNDVFVKGNFAITDSIIKIDEDQACISTEDIFATYQLWCKTNNSPCTYKFIGFAE